MSDDLANTYVLVRRSQAGDRAAFEELLGRYYERVRAIVRAQLGPKLRSVLDSGDIVQDTLLTAVQKFDRFEMRDDESLVQWLATLAVHKITDAAEYHSAKKRAPERVQPLADPAASNDIDLPDPAPSPTQVVAKRELSARAIACLAKLPESYRQVIQLRHFDDCSWQTVAEKTGRPSQGAARMMYAKAVLEFTALVKQEPNDAP